MRRDQKEAIIKVSQERTTLNRYYKAANEQLIHRELDCPEGPRLRAMLDWVRTLGTDDAEQLVNVVADQDWLLSASPSFRQVALRLLGDQICRIRKSAGLREFDDPLPGEPDAVFQIIRDILTGDGKCKSA